MTRSKLEALAVPDLIEPVVGYRQWRLRDGMLWPLYATGPWRRGVQTAVHYPIPVHLQPAYARLGHRPGSFPHAERACERVLSLPLFPEMTTEQVEYAALTLAEVVAP